MTLIPASQWARLPHIAVTQERAAQWCARGDVHGALQRPPDGPVNRRTWYVPADAPRPAPRPPGRPRVQAA